MQTKKRAKVARFGKKIEPVVEKKQEKIIEAVDYVIKQNEFNVNNEKLATSIPAAPQNYSLNESVKEEGPVSDEKKEEQMTNGATVNNNKVPETAEGIKTLRHEEIKNSDNQALETQIQETPKESVVNGEEIDASGGGDNAYVIETEVKRNLLRYFLIIALISFLIGLLSMAGISFFLQKKSIGLLLGTRKAVKITPNPTPTIVIVPTKIKEVNLAEYNIEVLNGSGITGAASKLKMTLTKEGFKVVSTGNADKSDYSDTIISAKKEVSSAYIDKLKENLKKEYSLASDSKTPVPATGEADVIIIIGSSSITKAPTNSPSE